MKRRKPFFLKIYAILATAALVAGGVVSYSQLAQAQAHSSALSAQIDSLSEQLAQCKARLSDTQAQLESAQKATTDTEKPADGTMVYVTPSGTKYHKSTCAYLSASSTALRKSEAQSKGYTACSKCKP